jgi:hypothetical protein
MFPDRHQILGLRDLPDPDVALGEDERELFGIIDSRRTIEEVVAAAPLSEYETYEALQRMVEAGWVEPVGRREPGHAPPPVEHPTPAGSARVRWERDLSMALLLVVAFAILRVSTHFLASAPVGHAGTDIFAASQVRDLRMALDLYRREHGAYPAGLQELVAEDWLSRDQLLVAGHELRYLRRSDRQSYQLEPDAGP